MADLFQITILALMGAHIATSIDNKVRAWHARSLETNDD